LVVGLSLTVAGSLEILGAALGPIMEATAELFTYRGEILTAFGVHSTPDAAWSVHPKVHWTIDLDAEEVNDRFACRVQLWVCRATNPLWPQRDRHAIQGVQGRDGALRGLICTCVGFRDV
jgi:hypothetical protein